MTFADIDRLHRALSEAPPTAPIGSLRLSKIIRMAVRWEMRTDNPGKGIERKGDKRKRYLKGDELARLTEALAGHRDQQAADIVRLLLLTGARKGETAGRHMGPDSISKTESGPSPARPRSRRPITSFRCRHRRGSCWLICTRRGMIPATCFPAGLATGARSRTSWASICKAAGIEGLASTICVTPTPAPWPVRALACRSSVRCWGTRSRAQPAATRICRTIRCAWRPSGRRHPERPAERGSRAATGPPPWS